MPEQSIWKMNKYSHIYQDVFENKQNYMERNYHANGVFDRNQIFIGGTGRSGTTIIARALSQHPDTLNFVEVRFLLLFKKKRELTDRLPYFYRNEKMYEKITSGLRIAGYRNANEIYSKKVLKNICMNDAATATKRFFEIGLKAWDKSVIIEKTPHTFLIANKLYRIFPNLRYIHVFRDPRDIFASVKPLHWGPKSAKGFISWYNDLMSKAYEVKKGVPAKNYLIVKLEDLVTDRHGELKKIFEFVNLKFKNSYEKIIKTSKAHVNRFKNDLAKKELDVVWSECKNEYTKWKKLYKKEKLKIINNKEKK